MLLGKRGLLVHRLQRPQGRPNAETGAHGPDPPAGKAEAQPDAEPETLEKYQSWKTFLDNAYWSVELK
jgi:hypothetical protein